MIERFIDIQVEKETPEFVLMLLLEVHPLAELLEVGQGWWWVGIVKPDAPAREIARATLERMRGNAGIIDFRKYSPKVVRRWLLQEQGFALCGKYRFGDEGPEWDAIVKDFTFADWVYRNWGAENETIRGQIQESGVLDDEVRLKARAATVERLKADERYLFSRLIRRNPAPVPVGVQL